MNSSTPIALLQATALKVQELRDSGFKYKEIDELLDLPTIGGGHSFSWRLMNDGRVKSWLASR